MRQRRVVGAEDPGVPEIDVDLFLERTSDTVWQFLI
jgi:hypothetical protein